MRPLPPKFLKIHVLFPRLFLIFSLLFSAQSQAVTSQPLLQKEALAAHNHWRRVHQAPPLSWDPALQHYAENHADHCVFKHSNPPAYGENLAAGYSTVTAAVNAWYAEGELYDYAHPGYSSASGHFTQVVWVGTQKLGCASVPCKGKNGTPGNYFVCEYSPPGNITNAGYFQQNVLPAQDSKF